MQPLLFVESLPSSIITLPANKPNRVSMAMEPPE
jgi:hypothetical protein